MQRLPASDSPSQFWCYSTRDPDLDIAISQLFFTLKPCDEVQIVWGSNTEAKRCGEFVYEHSETWRGIRTALKNLTYVAGFGALIWFVWALRSAKQGGPNRLFLPSVALASLITGPLLIINLFKEISGRSRPIHSLEFGGFEPFTAAGDFSGQCVRNCSFLSGEASGIFWLLVFLPLATTRWRWPAGVIVLGLAIFTSLLRIMFGRHYFSDVSISALVSLFCIGLFWWCFASPAGQRLLNNSGKRGTPSGDAGKRSPAE